MEHTALQWNFEIFPKRDLSQKMSRYIKQINSLTDSKTLALLGIGMYAWLPRQ